MQSFVTNDNYLVGNPLSSSEFLQEECENEGGHIVYIETSSENEWLKGDFLPRYCK